MRAWIIALFCITAPAAAAAHEFGVARPGGVYASAASEDAGGCAAACEADGLCMAWTWRAGVCELKATAPRPVIAAGAVSGLSARAPAFARAATVETPAPLPDLRAAFAPAPMPQVPASDDEIELLGGPLAHETAPSQS